LHYLFGWVFQILVLFLSLFILTCFSLNKCLIELNDLLCRLWCPGYPPDLTAVLCIRIRVRVLLVFVKSVDVLSSWLVEWMVFFFLC
jgi:hypothetical protein